MIAVRRKEQPAVTDGSIRATRVLGRFLAAMARRPEPVLFDLGPAVERNLVFFGEAGCRVLVADLMRDVERHATGGSPATLLAALTTRIPRAQGSIDGILCWDLFDYLERSAAEPLVRELARVLRPGGVLLALFNAVAVPPGGGPRHAKHVIVDRAHLEYRSCAGTRARQRPLANRDVQRLFEPLRIAESVLLSANVREVLFQKPDNGLPAAGPAGADC
jgi:SAM-dependent methyltransferase